MQLKFHEDKYREFEIEDKTFFFVDDEYKKDYLLHESEYLVLII